MADRVKQFIAVSVYKFANDLSPKYMEDVFKITNTRASRFASDVKLHIPNRNNDYGKNCLSYLGATFSNNIYNIIKQAKNYLEISKEGRMISTFIEVTVGSLAWSAPSS